MKAAIWTDYGGPEVLVVGETDMPVPKAGEILVKVGAANVFPGDCELRRFDVQPLFWLPIRLLTGIRKPRVKILGQELAGIVSALGPGVANHAIGDRVYGPTVFGGAYAQYCRIDASLAATTPAAVTDQEAAVFSVGALNALHFLRIADVRWGQHILVNGAAGCIGSMTIQIARVIGAHVTAVDQTSKLEAMRQMGADEVIDYTKQDFTQLDRHFDAVIDVVGKCDFGGTLKIIGDGGYLVLCNPSTSQMIRRVGAGLSSQVKVRVALTSYKPRAVEYLNGLLAEGHIKPWLDRTFALDEIAGAHRYVESGQKIGGVALLIGAPDGL